MRPESPSESPGFLLWRVTLAWQRSMAAVLLEHDLTHVQFVLLANVWWLGDWPNQRQLADHAGTDPMMTSQVLRTLEGKGLVDRVVDAADSRARRVALTELGRAAVDQAIPAVEAADAAFFAAVPRDEVLAVLSRLAGTLD